MKCEIIRDLIPLYCDGLGSDETRAAVEEHTARCEECGRLLEAAGAELEVPPQTYDEEEARVLRGVKKHYARIRWRAVVTAVIAVLAVASVAAMTAYHFYWPTHHHYPEI